MFNYAEELRGCVFDKACQNKAFNIGLGCFYISFLKSQQTDHRSVTSMINSTMLQNYTHLGASGVHYHPRRID